MHSPNSVAFGFRVWQMRGNNGMGNVVREDTVPVMPASAVRLGRNGVSGHAPAAEDMVPDHVDDLRIEEWHQCPQSPALAWPSQLQHGLALSPQAPPCNDTAWTRPVERHRRGE